MRYFRALSIATLLFSLCAASSAYANEGLETAVQNAANAVLGGIVHVMDSVLFYPIYGMPALVLWLIIGGIFFSFRLGFPQLRLFGHALRVVRGKYDNPNDPGEVTHFQALCSAVSGTVGLGNIAGVSVAVAIGGPGAVIWMMIAGFFGMTMKFTEVTMGLKYRKIDKNGKVSGGAFRYLTGGLEKRGMAGLGKAMAIAFAIFCVGASLGGGNMFQSNQAVSALTTNFYFLRGADTLLALILAVSVGVVLIGGIKRIAQVADKIVPFMAALYVASCLVVIFVNIDQLGEAIGIMFSSAFGGEQAVGGILGAIIAGVKRATFSNEAGVGSAPIAHAAAKTKEPVREGCVALLEPFLDTIVICTMTGIVITITGVYTNACGLSGEQVAGCIAAGSPLASAAFETVSHWFTYTLTAAILFFAYSTMITWSYYGERSWNYLFGTKMPRLVFPLLFCAATFFGGISNISVVIDFSDLMLFAMAVPNLIGLYIMHREIRADMDAYVEKLKAGKFKEVSSK